MSLRAFPDSRNCPPGCLLPRKHTNPTSEGWTGRRAVSVRFHRVQAHAAARCGQLEKAWAERGFPRAGREAAGRVLRQRHTMLKDKDRQQQAECQGRRGLLLGRTCAWRIILHRVPNVGKFRLSKYSGSNRFFRKLPSRDIILLPASSKFIPRQDGQNNSI